MPEPIQDYTVVNADGVKIYVPNNMNFNDDIPKMVKFRRANGLQAVGVSNIIKK